MYRPHTTEAILLPARKRVIENGIRKADSTSKTHDLSYLTGKKSQVNDPRNGIGVKSFGDKRYKNPECEKRFFEKPK